MDRSVEVVKTDTPESEVAAVDLKDLLDDKDPWIDSITSMVEDLASTNSDVSNPCGVSRCNSTSGGAGEGAGAFILIAAAGAAAVTIASRFTKRNRRGSWAR